MITSEYVIAKTNFQIKSLIDCVPNLPWPKLPDLIMKKSVQIKSLIDWVANLLWPKHNYETFKILKITIAVVAIDVQQTKTYIFHISRNL